MPSDPTTRAPSTPTREFVEKTVATAVTLIVTAVVMENVDNPEIAAAVGNAAGNASVVVLGGIISVGVGAFAALTNKLRNVFNDKSKETPTAKVRTVLLGQ